MFRAIFYSGLTTLVLLFFMIPVATANQDEPPPASGWISPTPDESGVITIIVQPDEALWTIAARAGLTVPELLALNDLDESAVIQPGDILIIGIGEVPPTPLSPEDLTPTPSRPPPTPLPTERPLQATVCLSAFEDLNEDSRHDNGEPLRANVVFTVYNNDEVVGNYITDGFSEPHCLVNLPPGEYHVTRSIAPDEILTTDGNWVLFLANESTLSQAFGSVLATSTRPPEKTEDTGIPEIYTATPEPVLVPASEPAGTSSRWSIAIMGVLFAGGLLLLGAVLILLRRKMGAKE